MVQPDHLAIGLALHLTIANLLARVLPPAQAFSVSALLVACLGLALGLRAIHRADLRGLLKAWPQLLAWVTIAIIIVQIGRGVGILDDRKNLSLISLMANGDVPPHFYMDAAVPFKYHYGAQLLGAELAVLGGLMPWSAFDVSKGVLGGLAILLAWHLGRRWTHRSLGGFALAGLVTFGSGARWLLLLMPPQWIESASQTLQLWGSGADTAPDLGTALVSDWTLSGGPPAGIPFAFVNGMNEPFVLGIQTAAVPLARALLFVLLLTLRRERSAGAVVVWVPALALLALAWETDFLLFGAGLLLVLAWQRLSRTSGKAGRSLTRICH